MERSYEDQENNLAPNSPRLPTLDSLTMKNMIVNKGGSSKTATNPNWYLLKRFGGEESKFSTYRPSIHRGGFAYTDTKIEGEECSMVNENFNKFFQGLVRAHKKATASLICKFFCILLLILFFIFIIVVVSLVLSKGRTIFGSI